jgi:hypothetical protein
MRLAHRLLVALAGPELADAITGDLVEGRQTHRSRVIARAWFLWSIVAIGRQS